MHVGNLPFLLIQASKLTRQRHLARVASLSRTHRELGTVSKSHQNPIPKTDLWSCRSSEEQTPQIVENNKKRVEVWEPKQAYYSLHTQVVRLET